MAGLTELRHLSTKILYQKLLTSNSEDRWIKQILLERQAAGYAVKFDEPVLGPIISGGGGSDDSFDYSTPRASDTELTGRVRSAYRSGYAAWEIER